jgi:endoglucanase
MVERSVRALVIRLLAVLALAAFGAPALAKTPPVANALAADAGLWAAYASQFITADGRVIDNVNGGISHTESQGYGMLLAVAAGDRASFERIWAFTEANLYTRPDGLGSWKWQPDGQGGGAVADPNNATDGDLLIAWALAEAAAAGFGDAYGPRARALVDAMQPMFADAAPFGLQMAPAAQGFSAAERDGRPVVNLSYWVFPAFDRLSQLVPSPAWDGLRASGMELIAQSSAFPAQLPPDWIALDAATGTLAAAPGFEDAFSYNAIRIPLYLALTGPSSRRVLRAGFGHWFAIEGPLPVVGVNDRVMRSRLTDPGYEAIRSLYLCATAGRAVPREMIDSLDANYYPATLQLMALLAVRQSFPKCA